MLGEYDICSAERLPMDNIDRFARSLCLRYIYFYHILCFGGIVLLLEFM